MDDEPVLCDILAEVLAAPSRSIEVRDTPRAALKFLEHNPVDLAFLDANMPGVTGLELADRIRKKYPQAHIVICSGYVGPELASERVIGRIDQVLEKPVDFGEVIELADSYATD